jgi:hypothetical protein
MSAQILTLRDALVWHQGFSCEQQGFNAIRVQGNWVQLRIRCSSAMYRAVFKSAVVLTAYHCCPAPESDVGSWVELMDGEIYTDADWP